MWRLIWRLVSTGIPFSFQPKVEETELYERIQKLSVWRGIRRSSNEPQVAFALSGQSFTAFVVKMSIWVLVRPIFYADIRLDGSTLTINGRFFLQKLIRVEFWLVTLAALAYECIAVIRCINRIRAGLPFDELIGFFVLLLPGVVVFVVTMGLLSFFLQKNADDIQILTESLQKIAT